MTSNPNGTGQLTPLGPVSLRTIDGVVGVFTPVAIQGGEESPECEANLQAIIDRLTQEIAILQQEKLALQTRLDRLLAPAKSPDDLATALQRTVDNLQGKLSSLSNPVSNFAVKDFRLETAITVAITELGTIEYRLLQPGSNTDPHSISKLTLSLAPIEKQRQEGTFSPLLFQPDKDLVSIGVNGDLRRLLEQNHIFTIGEFRSAASRAQVRASLIASEKTTQQELALLQARAELVLLAGVDQTIADTLIAAHIDSLQALARAAPEGLQLILEGVGTRQLTQWIQAAQAFTSVQPADQPHHVVAVRTNPAGLVLRQGTSGQYSPAAISRQLPAQQLLTVSTLKAQLKENGTGYVLAGWSTGGASATTTVQVTEDVAAIAHFQVACHSVRAATVSPGGKIALIPATGGVAGFPAHCYAPGTNAEIVVTPENGFALQGLTIMAGGTTQAVTALRTPVTVNAPVVARATFVPRPATVSTIFPPVQADDAGFYSRVFFAPLNPTPGFDVRVTDIRFETTAGSGAISLLSTLPISFGDLPENGTSSEQQLSYDIPPTATAFDIFITVQLKNAHGDVFTDQRSIGHTRPGAAV